MGRAYSLDLPERVVAAVAAGASCRSVAATFKVRSGTIYFSSDIENAIYKIAKK
jgi:transposase